MTTEFITDVIDIPQLIGYVREAAARTELPLAPFFPAVDTDDIEYELLNFDRVDMPVARYRSWDTVPPLAKRPGFHIIGGEIPPLGLSIKLNEKDIRRLDKLRAGIAEASDRRVVDTIFNDAVNMARAVQHRITLAQAELLQTGTVTVEASVSDGAVVATFPVPASQMNVVPAVPWSNHANATPVTDLLAWQKEFRKNNSGRNPDVWAVSSEVIGDLVLNAQIRALTPANADGGVRPVVTQATVAQVFLAQGIAPLVVVDDELPALDGSGLARIIDERKVIGVRLSTLGSTFYGVTTNASLLMGNGTIEAAAAPGIIAFAERSIKPPSVETTAEGVALPVLRDPNALTVAEV